MVVTANCQRARVSALMGSEPGARTGRSPRDQGPVGAGLVSSLSNRVRCHTRRMTDGSQLRVFLMDDHEVVRQGLKALVDAEPDMEVVGEASTASEALARVPALKPDVAVLDVRLPDGDGISVCRDLKSGMPELACLMLTSFGDDDALFSAIMAGASGYVLKQIKGNDLVGAVRTVGRGESLLDPAATGRLLQKMRDDAVRKDPLDGLTDQERKILEL